MDTIFAASLVILGAVALVMRKPLWKAYCLRGYLYNTVLLPRWCYAAQCLAGTLAGITLSWISDQASAHGDLDLRSGYVLTLAGLGLAILTTVCAFSKRIYLCGKRCHLAIYRRLKRNRVLPWVPGLVMIAYGLSLLWRINR
jgi:hypothetical protein